MERFLPDNPVARRAIVFTGVALALAIATQFVFPGSAGPARGTPAAILYAGLVVGLVTSLFATGVVLVYRTMRFVNFVQGPIGLVGVTLVSYLMVFTPVPFPIALLLGLGVSAIIGTAVGIFLLRFFNGSRLFMTVVTIVGSGFLVASVVTGVSRLPFWPSPDRLTTRELQDLARLSDNLPFQGFEYQIGKFPLNFGFNHIFAIELSIFALLAVGAFLRYTRWGTAVRAMAENPDRASLLGIGVGGLSVVVWTIAGALDGVGAILVSAAAPGVFGGAGGPGGFSFGSLLPPLAAAVVGRFRNLPTTIFAAVAIGIVGEAWGFSFPEDGELFTVLLFVLVGAGLLAQRKALSRSEAGDAVSWSATEEPRPIPKELSHVTGLRVARIALIVIGLVIVATLPFVLSVGRTHFAGVIVVNTIAVLSLVVLTGWAGQVSLGQFALVGVGAVVGGALTTRVGIPFWFAVPITIAVTAGVAVIVGLPALRIKGLFLLVTTLAFAVAASATLFNERYFGWLLPEQVDRPTLFFFNFEDEKSMYYLTVIGLALTVLVVFNLRRSRVGRLLIAMRESEANVQAFGVSVVRLKLLAFAIAGAMAGFAGVLFAHHQRGVSAESFLPNGSVNIFVAAVIGGVSSPGGALLGAGYIRVVAEFAQSNPLLQAIFNGFFPILLLFVAPGGLISLVNNARDSVLRVIAQRRRIVVPSLFADYDPDVLARQLIPFGDADANSGLAALPSDRRYTLRSELYIGKGERFVDRFIRTKQSRDGEAMGAAARRAEEFDVATSSAEVTS